MGERVDYWRQMDIVRPDELPAVTMIGAGGIGSFALLALAKMGVTDIAAYDDDIVEEHNLPNQLYEMDDVGLYKVAALGDICKLFTGIDVRMEMQRYPGENFTPVMISGVDSMTSRKDIWDKLKMKPAVQLYIDARMGAEVARIHSVNPCDPDHIKWYEATLCDDKDTLDEPCTSRAIIYNGFMIAALIASQVKKFAKHEMVPKEIIMDMKTLTLMVEE
jgi:hypothetical protein